MPLNCITLKYKTILLITYLYQKKFLITFYFLTLVTDDHNMTGSTIATKFSCNKKIKPQSLEGYEKDFRPYVLNPKYSCPTSLPLYFYFGYQILQETEQMKECGPVRHRLINKINTKKIVSKFSQICHIVL